MSSLDDNPSKTAQPAAAVGASGAPEHNSRATVDGLRRMSPWRIVARPWRAINQPRLFLESPWLLVSLFGSAGLLCGVVQGASQGMGQGLGKIVEGAVVGAFVMGVLGAGCLAPVAVVLWAVQRAGKLQSRTRRSETTQGSADIHPVSGTDLPSTFVYRPNRLYMFLLCLLAAAGEVLLCYLAFTDGDALFYLLAALGPIVLIAIGALAISAFVQERRIVVAPDHLVVPKPHWTGLSSEEIRIPLADIQGLWITPTSIALRYPQGRYVLMKMMFPSGREFDRLTAALAEAVSRSQSRAHPPSVGDH